LAADAANAVQMSDGGALFPFVGVRPISPRLLILLGFNRSPEQLSRLQPYLLGYYLV
jgi:hypothetical protein